MLSSNIFSTRKLLRRGDTLEVSFKRTRKWPLLEKKPQHQNFRGKLQIKCQEKKVYLKNDFSSSVPI